jgi:hypothetical protein
MYVYVLNYEFMYIHIHMHLYKYMYINTFPSNQALKIESKLQNVQNPADTHMYSYILHYIYIYYMCTHRYSFIHMYPSNQALKIESKLQNVQNPADTHINACAVLSQLGRHQSALGILHLYNFIINVYVYMSMSMYTYIDIFIHKCV